MRAILRLGVPIGAVSILTALTAFAVDPKPAAETAGAPAVAPASPTGTDQLPPIGAATPMVPRAEVRGAVPASGSSTVVAPSPTSSGRSKTVHFQFRAQPWKDVLDWFARQADLSLYMKRAPEGTFSYTDTREYTPTEALDLLNSVLATEGYVLLRHERMLVVQNLDDPIPDILIPTLSPDELDRKADFEFVHILFNLDKWKPEEAETEVKKLLSPQGSLIALTKTRQLFITDKVNRLQAIRKVINRIEDPDSSGSSKIRTFVLKYVRTDDVMPVLRQLLDIAEDKNVTTDGTLRFSDAAANGRLVMVTGQPDKLATVADIIKVLDVPGRPITFTMSPQAAEEAIERLKSKFGADQLQIVAPPEGSPEMTRPSPSRSAPDKATPDAEPTVPQKPKTRPINEKQTSDGNSLMSMPLGNRSTLSSPRGSAAHRAGISTRASATHTAAVPGRSITSRRGGRTHFVAQQPAATPAAPSKPAARSSSPSAAVTVQSSSPQVIVKVTPTGLTVSCDDPAVLEEVERVLGSVPRQSGGPLLPVIYLKYAKAKPLADELRDLFTDADGSSGGESGSSTTTAGSGAAKHLASGSIKITADTRLNALYVQANHSDLQRITDVAHMLDLKEGPDQTSVAVRARMIPCVHTRAQEVADELKEVYADRLITPSAGNQGANQFGRGGRGGGGQGGGGRGGRGGGGRGGRGGGGDDGGGGFGGFGGMMGGFGGFPGFGFNVGGGEDTTRDDANHLGIGVDVRTNSVIVTCTEPMYEEVKTLVEQIDVGAANEPPPTIAVVQLKTSADQMAQALGALGDGVQINQGASNTSNNLASSQPAWMRAAQTRNGTGTNGSPFGGGNNPFAGFGRGGGNGAPGGGATGGVGRFLQMMGGGGGAPGGGGGFGGFGGGGNGGRGGGGGGNGGGGNGGGSNGGGGRGGGGGGRGGRGGG